MTKSTIQVSLNKKLNHVQPLRMVIYKQSRIIEAKDDRNNLFYLFFYKNDYLTTVKASSLKLTSHISKAFINGLVFDGEHPLVSKMLEQKQSYPITSFNPLFKKVSQSYSPFETVLIYTFFDSFIPDAEIQKLMKNTYYSYRRNGQLHAAFRILKLFQQHNPNDTFTNDMLNNLTFQTYEVTYQDVSTLIKKDPLYLESLCYDQLQKSENVELLLELYQQENRWLDEIAIRLTLSSDLGANSIVKLQELISTHLSEDEQIEVITSVLKKSPNYHTSLQELLLNHLLRLNRPNDLVHYVVSYDLKPTPDSFPLLADGFKQADYDVFPPLFHNLNSKLIDLFNYDQKVLERVVTRCVSSFLNKYTLDEIVDWLKPITQTIHLPTEQKLTKMQTLINDPDQQYELGELYMYFHQPEMSIDCFKWEMELSPNNPKPVENLYKIYHEIGNIEEANNYQQLLIHMQK